MRVRSRVLGVVALVVVAVVFVACGGDDDGDGGGSTVTLTDGEVTVEARDVEFDITRINARPGELAVALVERGSLDHTFVLEDSDGNMIGDRLVVGAGTDEDSGTYSVQAGDYEYYCDIPGHRGQGMEGTLVVE
jgi:plastocyanin